MSWERLGAAVRDRRNELGLTQADVAARGGPSVETMRGLENNRAGRLRHRLRRALEQAIEWDAGSIDAILEGGVPRALGSATAIGPTPPPAPAGAEGVAAAERFAMAERLIKMRQAFASHRDTIPEAARLPLEREFIEAAREIEDAVVWMLPWLRDAERATAIRILAGLRSE